MTNDAVSKVEAAVREAVIGTLKEEGIRLDLSFTAKERCPDEILYTVFDAVSENFETYELGFPNGGFNVLLNIDEDHFHLSFGNRHWEGTRTLEDEIEKAIEELYIVSEQEMEEFLAMEDSLDEFIKAYVGEAFDPTEGEE